MLSSSVHHSPSTSDHPQITNEYWFTLQKQPLTIRVTWNRTCGGWFWWEITSISKSRKPVIAGQKPPQYPRMDAVYFAIHQLSQMQNRNMHWNSYSSKSIRLNTFFCASGRDKNGKYKKCFKDPKIDRKNETDEEKEDRQKSCNFLLLWEKIVQMK